MSRLHGLYVITDSQLLADDDALLLGVEAAIAGGASVVQYRDKSADQAKRLRQSRALLNLCRKHGVPLLINDDVALAVEIGADGVHLGLDDATLFEARERLGKQAIIGVSCYNQLALAQQAEQGGADYVAFGRFFSSNTKPNAVQASRELLLEAKQQIGVPIVAIGGITPENGGPLVATQADMLAVIHGVFAQADICTAAQNYTELFQNPKIRARRISNDAITQSI